MPCEAERPSSGPCHRCGTCYCTSICSARKDGTTTQCRPTHSNQHRVCLPPPNATHSISAWFSHTHARCCSPAVVTVLMTHSWRCVNSTWPCTGRHRPSIPCSETRYADHPPPLPSLPYCLHWLQADTLPGHRCAPFVLTARAPRLGCRS